MSRLIAQSDNDDSDMYLVGCYQRAYLHISFHSDTEVLANISHVLNAQSWDFIL